MPQPSPLSARPQTSLLAAEETRHAESFPARRLAKGRSQVPEPRCAGVAGAAPRLVAMAKGLGPNGPPSRAPGCSQRGPGPPDSDGKGLLRHPNLLAKGGRGAWAHTRTGCPLYQDAPGALRFALFIFSLEGGGHPLLLAHSDSQQPQGAHLESTAQLIAALPAGVTSGNSNSPSSSPSSLPVWEVMFHKGFPAVRSGPANREAAAGDAATRGRGPGAGEAGPGAAPTSSTVAARRQGCPGVPSPAGARRIGKGGSPRLLYPLNLFSTVPQLLQCSVQPLWVASGTKRSHPLPKSLEGVAIITMDATLYSYRSSHIKKCG
ncbi:uncharacterized protein LOC123614993 isoform X1 [Camelus bactrianus]|uniref:Uncharacterized protein LOC123614993 isoform X1 n=1 Tax=Camelus bactrianus TaxID=9837 RepID=A0AC58NP89_CAMBA